MGALQMRPYQQAAREAIHAEWNDGRRRTLLVLPTGTGKTIVFAAVTEDQVRSGSRVLVLYFTLRAFLYYFAKPSANF